MWHLKRHRRENGMPGLGQEEGRTVSKWASAVAKVKTRDCWTRVAFVIDAGHHVNACRAIYNNY
jgi:hypothetical protein